MNVSDISGEGINQELIACLKSWNIETLTNVQIQALDAGLTTGKSLIVSAPTSSGKTLIGEIAVLLSLQEGTKALYLVSHKALADQKYLDFVNRFGEDAVFPLASVGLQTGDRSEGDIDAQLLVATYEKALGLFLSGQLNPEDSLVIADELQIIGEVGRGPDIEALCSALRQRSIKQFIALTATVENPEDLAGWMKCDLVTNSHRDVPLHQEIWFSGRVFRTKFGNPEGRELEQVGIVSFELIDVVKRLIEQRKGPILVFTESRREATQYASAFGKSRPRVGEGIAIAEQLDFFSEPTESSDQLRENAERRVTFHTADLSAQERQVIEAGFQGSMFEVCFATSTLAAGVNFPFRSIVFPKLTYSWGDRAGTMILRSDYRNMSGRAGRLGMHPEGFAILLPKNNVELAHANKLVQPDNDILTSKLVSISLRKTILTLVASGLAVNLIGVMAFFENTLYWYQTLNRNPTKLESLRGESQAAIDWLISHNLLGNDAGTLTTTQLGKAAAMSGLLPATAVKLANILRVSNQDFASSFDEWTPGIIYAICSSDEFTSERPTRFLPYPSKKSYESVGFWTTKKLPVPLDRSDDRLAQCAQAMALYIEGIAERKIAYTTLISSGNINRLAIDIAWILDGLHKLAAVPELNCSQALGNQISMLARRVKLGAPAEALDVMRIAERYSVPGFGRQRAMALIGQGITTVHDVLITAKDKLVQLLRSEKRVEALLDAASNSMGDQKSRLASTHVKVAGSLGFSELVQQCNEALGTAYEGMVKQLLDIETSWIVTVLDDGMRQNVPDILLELGSHQLLIECKTCVKTPPLIKKEEAWAVLQKAADFDKKMKRITLGKPSFDETSKAKAAASHDITLIEHTVFMEGLIRVHLGSITPLNFVEWLAVSGVAEIERLGGKPTYLEKR